MRAIGSDDTAQAQILRSRVLVRGHRLAERDLSEVLENVVDSEGARVARGAAAMPDLVDRTAVQTNRITRQALDERACDKRATGGCVRRLEQHAFALLAREQVHIAG